MILSNLKYVDGVGFVEDEYKFDENKTDYEIVFRNGKRMKQLTPFYYVHEEWEDGEYESFVARFRDQEGIEAWYMPIELLGFMLNDGATINGIERIRK